MRRAFGRVGTGRLTAADADAALGQITDQAGAGSQFSQLDAGSWQTMVGGEAQAVDTFSHADDAAVAGENDAVAWSSEFLVDINEVKMRSLARVE